MMFNFLVVIFFYFISFLLFPINVRTLRYRHVKIFLYFLKKVTDTSDVTSCQLRFLHTTLN